MTSNPHEKGLLLSAGSAFADAAGVLILLHGRGGSARDILGLGQAICPSGWAMLAPQAAGQTWYPCSFLAPREENEPYLSSALERVRTTVESALAAGISADKIAIAGFSQGACLATEFAGRNPRRYGAVLAFTGGLIGPAGAPITLTGDLAGTPVLFSSGDPDPHVPWERVEKSAEAFRQIGGRVVVNRYSGRPHTILPEEIDAARKMLAGV